MRWLSFVVPPSAGLNNIKMMLACAIAFANSSKRQLLLPKIAHRLNGPLVMGLGELIDVPSTLSKGNIPVILAKNKDKRIPKGILTKEPYLINSPKFAHVIMANPFHLVKSVKRDPIYRRSLQAMRLVFRWQDEVDKVLSLMPSVYDALHARIEIDWFKHSKRPNRSKIWVPWGEVCKRFDKFISKTQELVQSENVPVLVICGESIMKENVKRWKGTTKRDIILRRQDLSPDTTLLPYPVQAAIDFELAVASRNFVGNGYSSFSIEVKNRRNRCSIYYVG